MLDQIPSKLSVAGSKRGMRSVPVGSVPVRSVASRRVLGFSGPKGFKDPSWEKSFPVLS